MSASFILLYFMAPLWHDQTVRTVSVPTVAHNVSNAVVIRAPVQLDINSISVSAPVYQVGLNSDGDMAIDDDPEQLAWYKLGPKPGEVGSAVIAGHYGWEDGKASIFNDLNKLSKGDKIIAQDAKGQKVTFAVTHTSLYFPEQDATNVFMSDDGEAHLNLITCQGTWNSQQSTYTERLVVFTDLVK